MKPVFSVAILSWKSPLTLRNTLASYKENGLLDLTDDVTIFFQEMSEADIAIAEQFDIQSIGSTENIGIGAAITKLVKNAKHEYVLFLENDWELVEPADVVRDQIEMGVCILSNGLADVVKMRSRFKYGDPLYTLQFMNTEQDCPEHMGDMVHWKKDPNLDFPDVIVRAHGINYGGREVCYFIQSKHCSQTNNPCLHTKKFYLEHIAPFSGQGDELEGKIREYWQSHNFTIAHSRGLFKHERLDR